MKHIVIVCNQNNTSSLGCNHKCFIGNDRAALIDRALAVKQEWELNSRNRNEAGPYVVLAGQITHAVRPVKYEMVELPALGFERIDN